MISKFQAGEVVWFDSYKTKTWIIAVVEEVREYPLHDIHYVIRYVYPGDAFHTRHGTFLPLKEDRLRKIEKEVNL